MHPSGLQCLLFLLIKSVVVMHSSYASLLMYSQHLPNSEESINFQEITENTYMNEVSIYSEQ